MKEITIEIDESLIPEGYEAVTYRLINEGELYCADYGEVVEADHDIMGNLGLILEKKRWRAEEGEEYLYISSVGTIDTKIERGSNADNVRHRICNYYKTDSKEIKPALERVRKAYLGDVD